MKIQMPAPWDLVTRLPRTLGLRDLIVSTALAAKSSAETPKKACRAARSEAMRREICRPAVAAMTTAPRSVLVVLVAATNYSLFR